MQYLNPRRRAIIENWPSGSNRVTAEFFVEATKRGERINRITAGKPKSTTYYKKMFIVDGDDGKTYLVGLCNEMDCIVVIPGTMQGCKYHWPEVHRADDTTDYPELIKLFQSSPGSNLIVEQVEQIGNILIVDVAVPPIT